MSNGYGRHLRLSVKGASHASEMTFTLENFPSGVRIDRATLVSLMERRAPGRDHLSTTRRETDAVEFRRGLNGELTDGSPIVGAIANRDMRPSDYGVERTVPRPGHADFGQWIESGRIPTGGGKNSGRMTAALTAAGALCIEYLKARGISISAEIVALGDCVHGSARDYERIIQKALRTGDSVGGVIGCSVTGVPAGVGGPLFDGLKTALSAAVFAIPGAKGLVFGDTPGCEFVSRTPGSKYNDPFVIDHGQVRTATNHHGGILGGRTTGMPICFSVAMRPTPTVRIEQNSVDLRTMSGARLTMGGRHDPSIVRRALPVVEAVTAFALTDLLLAAEAEHPRICLTLTGRTLAENIAQYRSERYFADMVELRVDALAVAEWAKVERFPKLLAKAAGGMKVPVILTFRRKCDGGSFSGRESERVSFFSKTLENGPYGSFAYVDFEEGFGDDRLVELAHRKGAKVIRSLHDFHGPVPKLRTRLRALRGHGDLAKVAFVPRRSSDVSRLFTDKSLAGSGNLIIAMGPLGLPTRVLAGRLGAPWTYATTGALRSLGQLTPFELVRDYRFRTASRSAELFGVTGWPLAKTRSPEIHNAAFAAEDRDALMIPFPAKTAGEALAFAKAMGMKGLAVTIPHKERLMTLLDRVSPAARRVGAVNTVVFADGRNCGYNTDVEGFTIAITAFVGRASFKGLKVAVLGAGGAAKAVVAALRHLGSKIETFHRRPLAPGFDLIVNATPVDPIPEYGFTGRELVYDLGYVPEMTPLLSRAAARGCRVENGLAMLRLQAAAQQRLWT